MLQNKVLVGYPVTINDLLNIGDVIGNPNDVAMEPNVYGYGCILYQRDLVDYSVKDTWRNVGTPALPNWSDKK